MIPELPPGNLEPPAGAEACALVVLALCLPLVGLLLALLRRRFSPRPAAAVLLALLGASWALLSVEMALRAYAGTHESQPYRRDLELIWVAAPNMRGTLLGPPGKQTRVSTNSLGLRDLEVPFEKRPGEFRILAVGDSWTFGSGVEGDEPWPKQLQRLLRERSPDRIVNVVNAGQNGFSYRQGYHLLRQLLPIYQPDLVVVGGFHVVSGEEARADEDLLHPALEPLGRVLARSHLYAVLRRRVAAPERTRPARGRVDKSLPYVQAMVDLLEGRQAIFFNQAFQSPNRKLKPGWYGPTCDLHLKHVTLPPGIATLQILPYWDPQQHGLMQVQDPLHPNEQGHRLMAEGLLRYLVDSGVLEGEAPRLPGRVVR